MIVADPVANGGMILSPFAKSAAPVPSRMPGSIRRTSTLDADWPDGGPSPTRLVGHARDVVTTTLSQQPIVVAEDKLLAVLTQDRSIADIHAAPARSGLAALVGVRAGGRLRAAIAQAAPDERRLATPLYLLLDDMAGASLVAPWALSHWSSEWLAKIRQHAKDHDPADVCIALRQGSGALEIRRHQFNFGVLTDELAHPEDSDGWLPFEMQTGPGFRRARWIEIRSNDAIEIVAGFQDSASTPTGERRVVHEYSLSGVVDPATFHILSLEATPHVLPYPQCGAGALTTAGLVGMHVGALRESVPIALRGALGCTHLNDALRALTEVPALIDHLRAVQADGAAR